MERINPHTNISPEKPRRVNTKDVSNKERASLLTMEPTWPHACHMQRHVNQDQSSGCHGGLFFLLLGSSESHVSKPAEQQIKIVVNFLSFTRGRPPLGLKKRQKIQGNHSLRTLEYVYKLLRCPQSASKLPVCDQSKGGGEGKGNEGLRRWWNYQSPAKYC